jgi:molecular chaperone DnaJ
MMMHSQGPCQACAGEGSRIIETCETCSGRAKVQEKRAIDVRIPAGTQHGETFTFQEVCSEVPEFEKAGDLQLTIESPAEGIWKRIGSGGQHLETEVILNLAESLLGLRVKLDGHPGWDEGLYVQIPAASFTGDSYCITGLGMPVKGAMNQSGDLYIRIRTTVKLAERESLKAMKEKLTEVFGAGCRAQEELPKDAEVQQELFLTKMP